MTGMIYRMMTVFLTGIFLFGPAYSETVYHLKDNPVAASDSADVRELIQENLPEGIRFPVSIGKKYSNMEICGMLNLMGLKDYVLVGNLAVINRKMDVPAETPPVPENGVPVTRTEPADGFYLKVADRGSGDVVLRKGSIMIVTRVRIVRGDRDGFLVQNPVSGKKFKVMESPDRDGSER